MPSVSDLISQILLKKLRQEALSPEEVAILAEWQGRSPEHAAFIDMLMDEALLSDKIRAMLEQDQSPAWQKIEHALEAQWNERSPRSGKPRRYKYLAAASIVLVLGMGAYYFLNSNPPVSQQTEATEPATIADIVPGGNRAALKLSDGSVIDLTKVANGMVAQQAGAPIVKQDGKLSYAKETVNQQQPVSNILTTPRGGQFRVELSDGTIVTLNAASSIKFQTSFNGNERKVELTGEAYFEVAKAPNKFIVIVNSIDGRKKAELEVLGTEFNIMGYDDEDSLKATLVHGKVKIASNNAAAKSLSPGQQAIIANGDDNIHIENVDTASNISWKNGTFSFINADLKTVMNQVSRWYNVDVENPAKISRSGFTGKLESSYTIEEVQATLQFYNVRISIGKGKITVLP